MLVYGIIWRTNSIKRFDSYIYDHIWPFTMLQDAISVGCLPVSRFILATLGMLTSEHHANNISLLLNSGLLALTQTVLRLIGEYWPRLLCCFWSWSWGLILSESFVNLYVYNAILPPKYSWTFSDVIIDASTKYNTVYQLAPKLECNHHA